MILDLECETIRSGVLSAVADSLGLLRGVECSVIENRLQASILIRSEESPALLATLADLITTGDVTAFHACRPGPGRLRKLFRSTGNKNELRLFVLGCYCLMDRVAVFWKKTSGDALLRLATQQEVEFYRLHGPGYVIQSQPRDIRLHKIGRDMPLDRIDLGSLEQLPQPAP